MVMGQMSRALKLNIGVTEILWPYKVVNVLQETMEKGLVMHPDGDSWKEGSDVMIQRAEDHLTAWKQIRVGTATDDGEDHLAHAFTDLMMAVAIEKGLNNE